MRGRTARVFASAFVSSRFTVVALFALAHGGMTRIAAAQAPTRTAPEIAPSSDPQYPLVADVKSIDGVMRAFYEVVSTAAGARANQPRDASFVTSMAIHGRAVNRGISSVQLFFDGTRWWITGWTNEDERKGHPIPARFLPR